MLKYDQGEEYKGHYDGGTPIGRSISCLCYLNDNFEGGEFNLIGVDQKIKAGDIMIFPSTFALKFSIS